MVSFPIYGIACGGLGAVIGRDVVSYVGVCHSALDDIQAAGRVALQHEFPSCLHAKQRTSVRSCLEAASTRLLLTEHIAADKRSCQH